MNSTPEKNDTTAVQEPRHTPGPWKLREAEYGHHILMGSALTDEAIGAYEVQHCLRYEHDLLPDDGGQYEEAQANGRLIAAAPDLLLAAQAALALITGAPDKGGETWTESALRKAIAKAEGRES